MKLSVSFQFLDRTIGRIPWTGDQLVTKTLLTALGDWDDREVGGMNGFGRGNRSALRKPAPTPLWPTQIPLARPGGESSYYCETKVILFLRCTPGDFMDWR
jgi:hypothetical protein